MSEKGKRQLAAIMFADMVGYTTLMQENEEEARLQRDKHRALISAAVENHHGEVHQYYGDGTLCLFDSAVEAVQSAIEIQLAVVEEAIIPLRIGVHTGEVVHDDDGIYGDGVNVASRIEGVSAPGGVAVSGKVFDEIKNHPSISTVSLGSVRLKNVAAPVSVYAITNKGLRVPSQGVGLEPTSPDAGPSRRYTDEEVRELLKRASELEKDGRTLTSSSEGPNLPELEAIAAEAGMNPVAVREAARELELKSLDGVVPSKGPSGLLGAPLAVQLKRTVPGEASGSVLESLIPVLRRASEGRGEPALQGRTVSCHSTTADKIRSLMVTASAAGGGTHLVIEERYTNMAWSIHGGLIGGLGGGVGLPVGFGVGFSIGLTGLGLAAFLTGIPLAAIGGGYLLSRRFYARYVRQRSKVLHGIMDEMVDFVEGGAGSEVQKRFGESPRGLLEG
jgi:class 3 adenylate cyclase